MLEGRSSVIRRPLRERSTKRVAPSAIEAVTDAGNQRSLVSIALEVGKLLYCRRRRCDNHRIPRNPERRPAARLESYLVARGGIERPWANFACRFAPPESGQGGIEPPTQGFSVLVTAILPCSRSASHVPRNTTFRVHHSIAVGRLGNWAITQFPCVARKPPRSCICQIAIRLYSGE
jgi:hypothetical protein